MVFQFVVWVFQIMKNACYIFPEPKEPHINSLSDSYPNTVCLVSYKTKKSFKTVFFKDNSYWLIPWKELTNPNSHYITSTFSSGLDRKSIICVHVSSIFELIAAGCIKSESTQLQTERVMQPKAKAKPWKQHGAGEEWSWGGWVLFLSCWVLAAASGRDSSLSNNRLQWEIWRCQNFHMNNERLSL